MPQGYTIPKKIYFYMNLMITTTKRAHMVMQTLFCVILIIVNSFEVYDPYLLSLLVDVNKLKPLLRLFKLM